MSQTMPHPFDTMMSFGKLMPGFEFLQGLVQGADQAVPGVGQWVVPSLDPRELDKRINDLKVVQFWLAQNSRMLLTAIQALEVQKMTLTTLQSMNVSMTDLKQAVRSSSAAAAPERASAQAAGPAAPPGGAPKSVASADASAPTPDPVQPAMDAMKMWGALSQQFTQMAHSALNDTFSAAAAGPAPGDPVPATHKAPPRASTPAPRAKAPGRASSKRAAGGAAQPTDATPPGRQRARTRQRQGTE